MFPSTYIASRFRPENVAAVPVSHHLKEVMARSDQVVFVEIEIRA